MKKVFWFLVLSFSFTSLFAQVDARLFRYPDVSSTQIAFVFGGDIWIAPKTGGTATRITSSTGEESFPRFSPDGKTLAFTASYRGNADVYTMPVTGGVPTRLTWHAMNDRVVDWHPMATRFYSHPFVKTQLAILTSYTCFQKMGDYRKNYPCLMVNLEVFHPTEKASHM